MHAGRIPRFSSFLRIEAVASLVLLQTVGRLRKPVFILCVELVCIRMFCLRFERLE